MRRGNAQDIVLLRANYQNMTAITAPWRWQDLGTEHRRWLIVHGLIVTAAINLVLGGLFAWLGVRNQHFVPVWTAPAGCSSRSVKSAPARRPVRAAS